MIRKCILIVMVLALGFFAEAKKKLILDLSFLNQATQKYRNAKMVQVSVDKIVKSELAGKQTNYKGIIYLSSGLFRLVNTEPEKSTLVFDGKTLWNEQPPSADFPGPVQVTRTDLVGKNKSQTLFASLLTKEPLTKNFKITSEKDEGDFAVYQAEPLTKDLSIKSLAVKIAKKSKQIAEISYQDDIGNLTVMKFSNPQFKKTLDKKLFQYTPPKGAQVNKI